MIKTSANKLDKIIGPLASVVGFMASLSFIEIIISNANNHSDIYVQPIIVAVNALLWSLHAILRKDWALLVPNIIAILLATTAAVCAFI